MPCLGPPPTVTALDGTKFMSTPLTDTPKRLDLELIAGCAKRDAVSICIVLYEFACVRVRDVGV